MLVLFGILLCVSLIKQRQSNSSMKDEKLSLIQAKEKKKPNRAPAQEKNVPRETTPANHKYIH